MKKEFSYVILLMILGFVSGCSSKGENPDEMIKLSKELDQKFIDAYNSRNIDGVMETYWNSSELVSFPPGEMEEKGWENVKKGMEGFFNSVDKIDLKLTDMNYKISGDNVISWGLWKMVIHDGNGSKMEMTGRYTDIKAKKNGKWVYILDHASVPLPSAGS